MRNERGVATLNFIMALVIGTGMAAILFAMSMTLMVVELTQYITYSSARAFIGASAEPADQQTNAVNKYNSLISNPVIAPFYSNGWFTVSAKGALEVRSGNTPSSTGLGSFKDEYPSAKEPNKEIWTGVRTKFTAKVLAMKLPMVGSTTEDDEGLTTRIMTVLIREPSSSECQQWMRDRYSRILTLDSKFSSGGFGANSGKYVQMEDNGC